MSKKKLVIRKHPHCQKPLTVRALDRGALENVRGGGGLQTCELPPPNPITLPDA